MRFENKFTQSKSAINMILANVNVARKLSLGSMSSSINDFKILQAFKVDAEPTKAPIIKLVTWYRLKCNLNVIVMVLLEELLVKLLVGVFSEITVQLYWIVLLKILVFSLLFTLNWLLKKGGIIYGLNVIRN